MASIAAHAFAAVTASMVLPKALRDHAHEVAIEVDLARADLTANADVPPVAPPTALTSPQPQKPSREVNHKRASIANTPNRTNDRPPAAAIAESAPPPPFAQPNLPTRFSLPAGTLTTLAPSPRAVGGGTHASTGSDGEDTLGTGEVLSEKDVNVPARPILRSEPSYPVEARQADIEADVPVQILVDTAGRVLEARSLTHHGYGLDEAATRAIQTWVFSPALRDGHPVRVWMRWTVQFRLR